MLSLRNQVLREEGVNSVLLQEEQGGVFTSFLSYELEAMGRCATIDHNYKVERRWRHLISVQLGRGAREVVSYD